MENQLTTTLYLTGEESDLRNARILLAGMPIGDDGNIKLRDLAEVLSLNVRCEGHIVGDELRFRADYIGFDTETPNQPPLEILDALCRKFPSLKYFYLVQLADKNITNDREQMFFILPKIRVDLFQKDQELYCESDTYDEALAWLSEQLHQHFHTEEDVNLFLDAQRDGETLNFCRVTRTQIVD